MRTSSEPATAAVEPPIRYTLAGGRIGAPSVGLWLRAVADAAVWLVAAPVVARVLGRVGARAGSARAEGWWARGVARALGIEIERQGVGLIDLDETYLVLPLHEGFADAVALLHLPLRLRFVARDELARWPVLGGYLRDTRQIVVRPEDGMRAYRTMARAARGVFAAGESLVVFPQGGILGIEAEFWGGAFALARALERPILPVALTGGHRVWEYPFGPRLRRGERINLRVLPPVSVAELKRRGVEEVRRGLQDRLKGAALDGRMALPRRFVPARDGYWDGYRYQIDPAFPDLAAEIARHRAERGEG